MSQPAGWYPQPDGSQRYWDGASWTGHVAPSAPSAPTATIPQTVAGAPAGPPSPKPKKPIYKRVWFWLVIVFVVLPVISAMLGGGGKTTGATPAVDSTSSAVSESEPAPEPSDEASSGEEAEPAPTEQVARIGDTITVGDLAVTVKSATRTSRLSNVFGAKKGHWMLVTVKVANKGKEQVMVNSSDFTLLESDGTAYSTDSDGMTYIDSDKWLFLKDINPKTSATGQVLFSIPKSAKNLTLQVSGGFFGMETGEISLGKK